MLLIPIGLVIVFWDDITEIGEDSRARQDEKRNRQCDLAIGAYTWQPDPVIKGRPAHLTFEVINEGSGPARDFKVEWWSNSQHQTATKTWQVDVLNTGERKPFTVEHIWPDNPGTEVRTQIRVDRLKSTGDNNGENNTLQRTVSLQPPPVQTCDILVRAWQWFPDPVVRGQGADVMFDIINQGPGEARNFVVHWFALSTATQAAEKWTVDRLTAGQPKSFEIKGYQWPVNTGIPLKFKVVIDPENQLPESNRGNNEKVVEVRVQTGGGSEGTGTVQDTRDGQVYKTVRIGGKIWLAENMKASTANSWCYNNMLQKCGEFGRLYTAEAAAEACRRLGGGWHLPSDAEWREMIGMFGGVADASHDGKAAYQSLINGGSTGFHILLGGCRHPNNAYFDADNFGYYWSGTALNTDMQWYYVFSRNHGKLSRGNRSKSWGYSCRCVKN